MPSHVVVSYARVDQHVVRVIVNVLRAAFNFRRAVYWDDDFQTGQEWAAQFKTEVERTRRVFGFWCAHSSASKHVRAEYNFALKCTKPVVPVLLDDTRLPRTLAKLHGIDLGSLFRHGRPKARKVAKKRVAEWTSFKDYGRRPVTSHGQASRKGAGKYACHSDAPRYGRTEGISVVRPRQPGPPVLSEERRRRLIEAFRPFLERERGRGRGAPR